MENFLKTDTFNDGLDAAESLLLLLSETVESKIDCVSAPVVESDINPVIPSSETTDLFVLNSEPPVPYEDEYEQQEKEKEEIKILQQRQEEEIKILQQQQEEEDRHPYRKIPKKRPSGLYFFTFDIYEVSKNGRRPGTFVYLVKDQPVYNVESNPPSFEWQVESIYKEEGSNGSPGKRGTTRCLRGRNHQKKANMSNSWFEQECNLIIKKNHI